MNYEEMYGKAGADTLVFAGGAVKRLEGYKIGGYGVLFTSPKDPDTYLEYFDKSTDYDFEENDKRTGYYSHGFDETIGNGKIGRASMRIDEVGVWLEGQVDQRHKYADAIMGMIEKEELGYSTGAVAHLCRRKSIGKKSNVAHITHWPIGEWSLTPTPAEPRTIAIPLKTWAGSLKGAVLGEHTEHEMAASAMNRLNDRLMSHIYSTLNDYGDEKRTENEKADHICNGFDEHCTTGKKVIRALVQGNHTTAKAIIDAAFKGEFARLDINSVRELEEALRDAGWTIKDAKSIASRFSLRDVESAPEATSDTFRADSLRELARIELRRMRELGVVL